MSYWNPGQWFNALFSGSPTEPTEQLVGERDVPLAANAAEVDKIAQTTHKLRALHTQMRRDTPSLFETFDSSKEPTDREVAQQLQIVILASISDLSVVSEASDALDTEIDNLESIIKIWEEVSTALDQAIASGKATQTIDYQNIEELGRFFEKMQKLGVPKKCH